MTQLFIMSILLTFATTSISFAQTLKNKITKTKGFITNFEQAQKEAKTFHQPIFAFFTGSDWCYWCDKLQEEVLTTDYFKKYAEDNFVLFMADFPQKKVIDEKTKAQNKDLATKYDVSAFPTVFLMDENGKVKVQSGYRMGGPENYIKELNDALAEGRTITGADMVIGCGYTANQRIAYMDVAPEGAKGLYHIEEYLGTCGIEQDLLTLIRSRVSQINGCAYCLEGHTFEAHEQSINDQKIYLLPVWKEAPCYTDRERAALAWAEELTLISEREVSDELFKKVRKYFTEKELMDLTYAIISINSWNRIAISMRLPVGERW